MFAESNLLHGLLSSDFDVQTPPNPLFPAPPVTASELSKIPQMVWEVVSSLLDRDSVKEGLSGTAGNIKHARARLNLLKLYMKEKGVAQQILNKVLPARAFHCEVALSLDNKNRALIVNEEGSYVCNRTWMSFEEARQRGKTIITRWDPFSYIAVSKKACYPCDGVFDAMEKVMQKKEPLTYLTTHNLTERMATELRAGSHGGFYGYGDMYNPNVIRPLKYLKGPRAAHQQNVKGIVEFHPVLIGWIAEHVIPLIIETMTVQIAIHFCLPADWTRELKKSDSTAPGSISRHTVLSE